MKKTYIIMITLLVFAGLLTAAERDMGKCQEGNPGKMQGRFEQKHEAGMMLMHLAEELDLSESQIAELHDLHMENQKYMIQKKADIKILQIDKRKAMKDKDFAEAKIITGKIFELKQETAMQKIDQHADQWDILTDEQKQQAEELKLEKMHSQPEKHHGRGLKKGM